MVCLGNLWILWRRCQHLQKQRPPRHQTRLCKQVEEASPDLLRELVRSFANSLMSAEVDALCGAGYGERSPERTNSRNGYRPRTWDTRTGTMELAVPKLRSGSYFPDWLLQPRRRAERALIAVVAECYVRGVSTRRVEGLVRTLGIEHMSKSQVSELCQSLDPLVADFRNRPLDAGPYTYVWIDALVQRVREGAASSVSPPWWPPGSTRTGTARSSASTW